MIKYFLILNVVSLLLLASSCGMVVQYDPHQQYDIHQNQLTSYIRGISSYEQQNDDIEIVYIGALAPHYPSVSLMVYVATDIIRVKVLDERVLRINTIVGADPTDIDDRSFIYTVYRVEILEVFSGELEPGDILDVGELGGQYGNIYYMNRDRAGLEIGDDLVLFIRYSRIENMPAWLLSPIQAVYRFTPVNENAIQRNINDELESLSEYNDLTLTLEDLQRISEGEFE